MDSFELNKIAGAILGTLLFVMGVGFLAEAIYHPAESSEVGYALPEPEEGGGDEGGPVGVPTVSIATLLASADPVAGESSAKKCATCHDFSQASANKTGPGLYDVVERLIGSHEGFAYSAAMLEHKDKGDHWTYENLNAFLTTPKAFTPGTKMTFAGVKNDEERANIIAYLSTLSASPKPFPAPETPAVEGAPSSEQIVEAPASEAPAASSSEPPAVEAPVSSEPAPASSESSSAPEP